MSARYRPERDLIPVVPASDGGRDLTTQDGATELAAALDAWWHERGFPSVHHTVEWAPFARSPGANRRDQLGRASGTWIVSSNLRNGLPPR
jgi:hypothetical protein